MNNIIDFIIDELKQYKLNKAILETMQLENEFCVQAQRLSDMPRSVTNKFSSATENHVFGSKDLTELMRDIKRVDIWIGLLNDEERFVICNFYIENRSYNIISKLWEHGNGIYFSNLYWKRKRKAAIYKISKIYMNDTKLILK